MGKTHNECNKATENKSNINNEVFHEENDLATKEEDF